jgi:hypothetical protein
MRLTWMSAELPAAREALQVAAGAEKRHCLCIKFLLARRAVAPRVTAPSLWTLLSNLGS